MTGRTSAKLDLQESRFYQFIFTENGDLSVRVVGSEMKECHDKDKY